MTTIRKYYCDTCDKSFCTDDDLYFHEGEHETCGRDGCTFTAHPKIILKHKRLQHDSGLFKRIGKLYTDEEISKWIEERKKKYPTRKVIEEKKTLELEKEKRGEKIKVDKSRFNKDLRRRRKDKLHKKIKEKIGRSKRPKKKAKFSFLQYTSADESTSMIRSGVKAFSGIGEDNKLLSTLEKENDLEISDEEWLSSECLPSSNNILMNKSLSILASAYDSNDEAIEEEYQKENELKSYDGDEEDCPPNEVKTIKTLPTEENLVNDEVQKICRKKNTQQRQLKIKENTLKSHLHQTRRVTLLEKLLENEIRHERNVILQCVHYVVKNNFFDKT